METNHSTEKLVTIVLPLQTITESIKPMVSELINEIDINSKVSDILDSHDFDDTLENAIDNYDFDDKFENAIDVYDFDDKFKSVMDDYDIDRKVEEAISSYENEIDYEEVAFNLLTSFNINGTCKTGLVFMKSVESIIEKYLEKSKENTITPSQDIDPYNVAFTLREIQQVMAQMNYDADSTSRLCQKLLVQFTGIKPQ